MQTVFSGLELSSGPLLEHSIGYTTATAALLYVRGGRGAVHLAAKRGAVISAPGSPSAPLEPHRLLYIARGAWRDRRLEALAEFQVNLYETAVVAALGHDGVFVAAKHQPQPFEPDEISFFESLAQPLARLIDAETLREERDRAVERLANRGVVERAKGLIQARDGCTEDEAYSHLRRLSRTTRRPIHEIARHILGPQTLDSRGISA